MRHYKLWIGIVVAVVVLFLGGTMGYLVYLRQQTAAFSYKENNQNYPNPARGMYAQLYHTEEQETLDSMADGGRLLVLITMDLQNYTRASISAQELTHLESLLQRARERGVMVMFRASYKQDESMEEPSLDVMHEHIAQLSELLNEYKDVVLLVQAGMIGLWGEWHTSKYLSDETAIREEAGQVVRWWLDTLDEDIVLNLRRPSYIRLMEEEGMDVSRLGYHDDGLLGSDTDLGTYRDREEELAWCAANLNGRFNGGEMPGVNSFSEPENAVEEFDELSLSYLNYYYNTEVLDDWRSKTYGGENAYDYIERHLGYRYSIARIEIQNYIFRSQRSFHIRLELANSGFSTIHRRFGLYAVVDDGSRKSYVPLERVNTDKSPEIYEARIPVDGLAPFQLGFCYTDAAEPGEDEGAHYVAFANDEVQYQDGVNMILRYDWAGRMGNRMVVRELQSPE